MNARSNSAFYYHAHANSLGGTLRQPLQRVVSTDASASLASAGGFTSRRVERFHVDGLISVHAAHVRVSGSEHVLDLRPSDGEHKQVRSWRTTTAATVEGLNILEVLTADRVVAQVSVDHPQEKGVESKITLLGSRFENLRVHGKLLTPRLSKKMFGVGRAGSPPAGVTSNSPLAFKELFAVAKEQHATRTAAANVQKAHARFPHVEPDADLKEKGSALCSLVEGVRARAPIESFSHILHIPDFGNVFLGELLVSPFSAQLTMVRVEMGCMADGELSACSVYSNGRTMP